MTMTIIFLILAGTLAAFVAYAVFAGGTRKPTPRPSTIDYDNRYRGAHDGVCDVCGEPSFYTRHGVTQPHPWCKAGSRVMTP